MPAFPKCRGELPDCLNPLNIKHYLLVAYWIYFRPTTLQYYLYEAAPNLYLLRGLEKIRSTWKIPVYRNLYEMASRTLVLFLIILMLLFDISSFNHYDNAITSGIVLQDQQVITAYSDGSIKAWNIENRAVQYTIKTNAYGVTAATVTPDNSYILASLTDRIDPSHRERFSTWDFFRLLPHIERYFKGRVIERNFATENNTENVNIGSIKVWDRENRTLRFILDGHTDKINSISATPNSKKAVSASDDRTLKVWDLENSKLLLTLEGHTGGVNAVTITPDGSQAVSASDDHTLKVWDLENGKTLFTLQGHTGGVNAVTITPNGKQAVSASGDRTLKIWELDDRSKNRDLLKKMTREIRDLSITSNGRSIIFFSSKSPSIFDIKNGYVRRPSDTLLARLHLSILMYPLEFLGVISGFFCIPLIIAFFVAILGLFGAFCAHSFASIVFEFIIGMLFGNAFLILLNIVPESFLNLVAFYFVALFGIVSSSASNLSGRKALGVVGVGFMSIIWWLFAGGFSIGFLPHPDVSFNLGERILIHSLILLVWCLSGAIVISLGLSRIALYPVLLINAFRSKNGRHKHPVEWDELFVLPLPGTVQTLLNQLRNNEDDGLSLLAEVTQNPFQRASAQRSLHLYLHQHDMPLHLLYDLLTKKELNSYIYAPIIKKDWNNLPSIGNVLLGELGKQWVNCSSGQLNRCAEYFVWKITNFSRIRDDTPLTCFAQFLYAFLDEKKVYEDRFDLSLYRGVWTDLNLFVGGEEVSHSFDVLAIFLAYQKLANLGEAVELVSMLGPADTAIRPTVITALTRLGSIGAEITTYQVATSRVNKLAALARATKALNVLERYIVDNVIAPEKHLLQRIAHQWHPLIGEASIEIGVVEEIGPISNPYVAGNPVTGDLFVGREDKFLRLEELWMQSGQCPSVILYGHRRMGKSSILKNLVNRFDSQTTIVDFNMQLVGQVNTGELLHNLALALYDSLSSAQKEQQGEPDEVTFISKSPYTPFKRWLNQLDTVRQEQRFIVTIDEFELLESMMQQGCVEPYLLDYLRGIIQTYPWLILAFAGLHTLHEMTQDYWNPLFGSVTAINVSFLSPKAAERLIVQPSPDFSIDYAPEAVHRIIELTNGQPYLIQLVGHTLVTRFNRQTFEEGIERERRFTFEDVEAVINSPEFYRDGNAYFTGVWGQAQTSKPSGQAEILQVLSHNNLALPQLSEQVCLSIEQTQDALEPLLNHDVIAENETTYAFTVELMRRWVAQFQSASPHM